MSRRSKPVNKHGCKPDDDVCVEHDRPLECRHGCSNALPRTRTVSADSLLDTIEKAIGQPFTPVTRLTLGDVRRIVAAHESSPSADPVACCWETSHGEFHAFRPFKDAPNSVMACAAMEQTFHLLYRGPPKPDLSQLQSELAALDYKSEHSDEHRLGFELAKEAARALVARFDRFTS